MEPPKNILWSNRNAFERPIVDPWQVWRENGAISNGGKSLHKFYCTALGVVATVVSLTDSLGGAVCKLSNKRSSIPDGKSMTSLFRSTAKMVRRVAKFQKISISKERRWLQFRKRMKIISHFSLLEYTRKHNTVSSNPNQRTFEVRSHSGKIYCSSAITSLFLRSHLVTL